MLKLHVIASGSKGNAALVENAASGRCVLIDCGICKRDLFDALAKADIAPGRIESILITHEHTDHTKGLAVCVRGLAKAGSFPAIRTSPAVRQSSTQIEEALETGNDFAGFRAGDAISACGMQIHVFPTSHDAAESFGFRIECEDSTGRRDVLAYMTDTGYVTAEAREALADARILAIEANHDRQMLENGPYPYVLKRRIASEKGHLSNDDAASEVAHLINSGGAGALEHVVGMHVSQKNNRYELAQQMLAKTLTEHGHPAKAHSAKQSSSSIFG